jgi:hypothetical protein
MIPESPEKVWQDEVRETLRRIEDQARATNGRVSEIEVRHRIEDAVKSTQAQIATAAAVALREKAHDVADSLKDKAEDTRLALGVNERRVSLRITVVAMICASVLSGSLVGFTAMVLALTGH